MLKVLVTSRAVLRVYGEHEYPVPPLARACIRPQSFGQLECNPAVRTVQAARRGGKTRLPADGGAMQRRRRDLPAARRLAAGNRARGRTGEDVSGRGDPGTSARSSLDFLIGGARERPARQQTLRHTIDWSHRAVDLRRAEAVSAARRLRGRLHARRRRGRVQRRPRSRARRRERHRARSSRRAWSSRLERSADEAASTCSRRCGSTRSSGCAASGDEARQATCARRLLHRARGRRQPVADWPPKRADWLARCDVEDDNFRAALDWLVDTGNAEWALRLGLALFRVLGAPRASDRGAAAAAGDPRISMVQRRHQGMGGGARRTLAHRCSGAGRQRSGTVRASQRGTRWRHFARWGTREAWPRS